MCEAACLYSRAIRQLTAGRGAAITEWIHRLDYAKPTSPAPLCGESPCESQHCLGLPSSTSQVMTGADLGIAVHECHDKAYAKLASQATVGVGAEARKGGTL